MRLVLLGPPGSGKGTQASALARHFDVPTVSTGDLLRANPAGGSPEAGALASLVARGDLVPDDAILAVLNAALAAPEYANGYILDGFPRTLAQAEHPAAPTVDAVVHLIVPDDDVRGRLEERARLGRTDDKDRSAVERRLRHYHTEIPPLLDFYRGKGLLTEVDAAQAPAAVTTDILGAVGAEAGGDDAG